MRARAFATAHGGVPSPGGQGTWARPRSSEVATSARWVASTSRENDSAVGAASGARSIRATTTHAAPQDVLSGLPSAGPYGRVMSPSVEQVLHSGVPLLGPDHDAALRR